MARVQGRGAKPTDGDVQHAAEIIISTAEHEAKIAGGWREVFQMGESQVRSPSLHYTSRVRG